MNIWVASDGSRPFSDAPDSQRAVVTAKLLWTSTTKMFFLENYKGNTQICIIQSNKLSTKETWLHSSKNISILIRLSYLTDGITKKIELEL